MSSESTPEGPDAPLDFRVIEWMRDSSILKQTAGDREEGARNQGFDLAVWMLGNQFLHGGLGESSNTGGDLTGA